ncbi:glycosyltransferase [Salidesulfovibrio brasiliensis]|uniref:glycosyltransferase n=1 Tax=Salidesulfovibrio brasiliensis TaxID=221711 RepID=UPI0006D2C68D|nr:glycosyltransferase [Salidesulfovibrio brasiliensis]
MKKVSLVIPNFNQAAYLPGCVDHCWFQTYPNIELIIVDGGSTDGTKEYLAGLSDRIAERTEHPVLFMDAEGNVQQKACRSYHEDTHAEHPLREVKIIASEEDLGRTGTYNAGFELVTGDYCTYIVGDDLPHPHMVEELVNALESSGADVAYSDFNIITDDDRIRRLVRKPDYSFEACFADWFHLGVSTLSRTERLREVGFMNEDWQIANDYRLYLDMARAGAEFVHVPKVLYSVRYHGAESKLDESRRLAFEARELLGTDG